MLTIEVEFLANRYTATSAFDYQEPEWPPHPGRLFSALCCSYAEGDFGPAERRALTRLESLRAPSISASHAVQRDAPVAYVPPNDFKDRLETIPQFRNTKAARRFPTMIPDNPVVRMSWPDSSRNASEKDRLAIQRLAEGVQYLGHSSTPVRVQVTDSEIDPTYEPHPSGRIPIRVPRPGRLDELEYRFSIGERPVPCATASYRIGAASGDRTSPETCFNEMIVFRRTDGARFPLEGTHKLTSKVRKAIISRAEDPVPSVVTGHKSQGPPLQDDHIAIIPLANVANRWADGAILGFAILVPRLATEDQRRHIYRALESHTDRDDRLEVLTFRNAPHMHVTRTPVPKRTTLQPDTYREGARRWATVTPMVFDRYPKDKPGARKDDILAGACKRIGLPKPKAVAYDNHSPLIGTPPASQFVVSSKARFAKRPRTHMVVEFDEPVRGPIVLGAGRYFGFGLLRPWHGDNES